MYAAVAIHPNETGAVYREREPVLAAISALAESPRVVAIGETGLDYYRDYSARDVQLAWFRAHIELARRTGKALMIHDRDAHEDVLSVLEEYAPWPPYSVIFHCFSGDAAMAERCAAAGYLMSFAGNVTFKNADALRGAAHVAPPELMLAETDAPVPHPGPAPRQAELPGDDRLHDPLPSGAEEPGRSGLLHHPAVDGKPCLRLVAAAWLPSGALNSRRWTFGYIGVCLNVHDVAAPGRGGRHERAGAAARCGGHPRHSGQARGAPDQEARPELRRRAGHRPADRGAGRGPAWRRDPRGRPRPRLADPRVD